MVVHGVEECDSGGGGGGGGRGGAVMTPEAVINTLFHIDIYCIDYNIYKLMYICMSVGASDYDIKRDGDQWPSMTNPFGFFI